VHNRQPLGERDGHFHRSTSAAKSAVRRSESCRPSGALRRPSSSTSPGGVSAGRARDPGLVCRLHGAQDLFCPTATVTSRSRAVCANRLSGRGSRMRRARIVVMDALGISEHEIDGGDSAFLFARTHSDDRGSAAAYERRRAKISSRHNTSLLRVRAPTTGDRCGLFCGRARQRQTCRWTVCVGRCRAQPHARQDRRDCQPFP
jgi:hypothetical protein